MAGWKRSSGDISVDGPSFSNKAKRRVSKATYDIFYVSKSIKLWPDWSVI